MPSLLDRVGDALAPRYEVDNEIASGGMAVLFRARDTALDRLVAVKVLRPDMATATGEARFLREARTLAAFRHPNVVAIHDVDQSEGLSYYVMDFIAGDTLAQRLARGPLDWREVSRLGRDLLEALERLHAAGIVHRDVKPSNVFLSDGRALLADFGIAQVDDPGDDILTSDGHSPGTPAYMSPEQTRGGQVTSRSDLYSLGMVLYEGLAGRRWTTGEAPEAGDWSGVPTTARSVLKRALALDPERRWAAAAEFRAALRIRGPAVRLPRWAAVLLVAVVAYLAWWSAGRPGFREPNPREALLDVAVFPCEAAEPEDAEMAARIAWRVNQNLEIIPGITRASAKAAASLYERREGDIHASDWSGALKASHAARCQVDRTEDGISIYFWLLNASGHPIDSEVMSVSGDSDPELMRSAAAGISRHIVGVLAPGIIVTEEDVDRFANVPWDALRPFYWGDYDLRLGAWASAAKRYGESLAADPTFTLARLRLAEAHRWLADRPIGADLDSIRQMDLSSLSALDSLLLVAGATPHGPAQLSAYESILARPEYRFDPYVRLLYADELYHRGALWGVPIDSAIGQLKLAVARDSNLVPAVEHLTQALIRTGREGEAAAALAHLRRIHAGPEEPGLYYPDVWAWGFHEKFKPEEARQGRLEASRQPLPRFAVYARFVRYIDSPATQAHFGSLLVEAADSLGDAQYAAQGFVDRGLGLIGMGRVDEGIAAFDSAARRFETPETVAQAAEWAVVPYALGVEGFGTDRVAGGERQLEAMWSRTGIDECLRIRAGVALALLADRRRDERGRADWAARLGSLACDPTADASRPARLASALVIASHGAWRAALDSTAGDLAYDSIGLAQRPFLRSALHLKRGEWYAELGMPDSASASWLWYQNTDLEGTVEPQLVQAGEVDGALGPYAKQLIDRVEAKGEP